MEAAFENAFQYGDTTDTADSTFFASPSGSTLSKCPITFSMLEIATSDALLKVGISFTPSVSFKPSIACPAVLYDVASLVNDLFVPTFAIALKKSSVLTFPSCTSCTSCDVVFPMPLATAAIPAGVCSSINLKSIHWIVGFAAACVACWLNVFIACVGFSEAAANPPKPFTSFVQFFVPTAAN